MFHSLQANREGMVKNLESLKQILESQHSLTAVITKKSHDYLGLAVDRK